MAATSRGLLERGLTALNGARPGEKLIASGVTNVVHVEGVTLAWDQAGLPVVRGKKAISLERQVRIVAGLMVFAGSLLAITNPWWLILPGFVGAGLAFAGITDTCGMAMILAKMPWNQVPQPAVSLAAPGTASVPTSAVSSAGSCQSNAGNCCS